MWDLLESVDFFYLYQKIAANNIFDLHVQPLFSTQ